MQSLQSERAPQAACTSSLHIIHYSQEEDLLQDCHEAYDCACRQLSLSEDLSYLKTQPCYLQCGIHLPTYRFDLYSTLWLFTAISWASKRTYTQLKIQVTGSSFITRSTSFALSAYSNQVHLFPNISLILPFGGTGHAY